MENKDINTITKDDFTIKDILEDKFIHFIIFILNTN